MKGGIILSNGGIILIKGGIILINEGITLKGGMILIIIASGNK